MHLKGCSLLKNSFSCLKIFFSSSQKTQFPYLVILSVVHVPIMMPPSSIKALFDFLKQNEEMEKFLKICSWYRLWHLHHVVAPEIFKQKTKIEIYLFSSSNSVSYISCYLVGLTFYTYNIKSEQFCGKTFFMLNKNILVTSYFMSDRWVCAIKCNQIWLASSHYNFSPRLKKGLTWNLHKITS